jgi:hypothetical protein
VYYCDEDGVSRRAPCQLYCSYSHYPLGKVHWRVAAVAVAAVAAVAAAAVVADSTHGALDEAGTL